MVDVVHRTDIFSQLQQILDRRHEIRRIQRALVERSLQPELDVEFQPSNFAEIILPRVEKHPVEKRRRRFQRRRIAGTQFAINFNQRFLGRANRVLLQRAPNDDAYVVAVGESNVHFRDSGFANRTPHFRRQRLIGFQQNFAGLPVHQLADGDRAFQIGRTDFRLCHARLGQFLVQRLADAFVRAHQHVPRFRVLDFLRQLAIDQALRNVPEKLAIFQRNALHLIERPQNVFIRFHSQRPKENRAQEFALAVDAHVQNILGVVLELHPRSAVGNNFSQEVAAVVRRLEENSGRTVQLTDDYALRSIDDERPVLRHQRNIAEENFLLLNIADGLRARVRVFIVNRQTNGDFQRRGIRHPALLALVHVVLQLQRDRVSALVAESRRVLIERAALGAKHVACLIRIRHYRSAAIPARCAQVMEPAQVSALALPVADRVVHEIQLRQSAEILYRKYGRKHRLQAGVFALARQQIHLQEALVRLLLYVNQVRNLDRRLDFGEVQALPFPSSAITVSIAHRLTSSGLRRMRRRG